MYVVVRWAWHYCIYVCSSEVGVLLLSLVVRWVCPVFAIVLGWVCPSNKLGVPHNKVGVPQ